jgi:hypothetical protein
MRSGASDSPLSSIRFCVSKELSEHSLANIGITMMTVCTAARAVGPIYLPLTRSLSLVLVGHHLMRQLLMLQ